MRGVFGGKHILEIAKLLHAALRTQSPWLFVLECGGLGFLLFASVGFLIDRGYQEQLKQEKVQVDRGPGGPYLILEYSPTVNGPSGFAVRNDGPENAVRIRVADVRVGERVAKFGELASIRNDGGPRTIYPQVVEHPPDERPQRANDLQFVFDALPDGEQAEISVSYWGTDNIRYVTWCLFKKYSARNVSLLTHRRERLPEPDPL